MSWIVSPPTCFDDAAQLIEQKFVVSSCVQPLLHVAVEFIHHTLHICVLVLLDTRHPDITAPQLCRSTEIEFQILVRRLIQNQVRTTRTCSQPGATEAASHELTRKAAFLGGNERGSSSCRLQRRGHSPPHYPSPQPVHSP